MQKNKKQFILNNIYINFNIYIESIFSINIFFVMKVCKI